VFFGVSFPLNIILRIGEKGTIWEIQQSYFRPHSYRREKERKPQEANINLPYFHGKDNVEAYLD